MENRGKASLFGSQAQTKDWWNAWWASIKGEDPYEYQKRKGRVAPSQEKDWLTPRTKGLERDIIAGRKGPGTPGWGPEDRDVDPFGMGQPGGMESIGGYDYLLWLMDEGKKRYEPVGRTEKEPEMPGGLYKTYDEALNKAGKNYIPTQDPQTGYWALKYKSPKDAADMPAGFFKDYASAAAAAQEGYVPQQQAGGWWGLGRDPSGMSDYERQALEASQQSMDWQQGMSEREFEWSREMFGLQQEEAQRQRLAQLGASPVSWLQFAAEGEEPPVIQPWMKSLMPQEYQSLAVGSEIPGWSAEDMTSMPELMNPSAQYLSRIGPSQRQQYYGYEQARTGAPPEETQWRQWKGSPPGGRFSGFSRGR